MYQVNNSPNSLCCIDQPLDAERGIFPPIYKNLPKEWWDAWEKYGKNIQAGLESERIIMRRTEAARRADWEARQREQAKIRAEYRREMDRLLRLISFDRDAVLKTLGLAEMVNDYEAGEYL